MLWRYCFLTDALADVSFDTDIAVVVGFGNAANVVANCVAGTNVVFVGVFIVFAFVNVAFLYLCCCF